jgi:hypothetical protein
MKIMKTSMSQGITVKECVKAGSLVLVGIIGAGIDGATGAYSGLYPNPVAVHLVAREKSAAATMISINDPRN